MRIATKFAEKLLRKLGVPVAPPWARSPTYGAPGLETGKPVPPAWAGAGRDWRRASAAQNLLPCDVRPSEHFPGSRQKVYGVDRSGTVEYRFNSAGYRSEELDPNARLRICVLGESHIIGTGIAFERTVAQRLKTHLAEALGWPETAVNVINLAVGGSSLDYCVRTLIRQIDIVRPDFVFLNTPAVDRMEDYSPEEGFNYTIGGVDIDRIDEMPEAIQGFFDLYNPTLGRMNQVRNALMFQMVCHTRGFEHLISSHALKPKRFQEPVLKPIFEQLDRDRIMVNKFFNVRPDLAADNSHAGPRSHEAMAIAVLDRYARLVQQTGQAAAAAKLRTHAERLKAESADWAFMIDSVSRERSMPQRAEAKA